MRRRGLGIELNKDYWTYGVGYCEQAENEMRTPTLFDFMEFEETPELEVAV